MALVTGISKYHFIRVFKAAFGISSYQYQKRKPLELAKFDLLSGEEILFTALRYGFADTPTFSKAFKMQFGVTPGSVKKSNFYNTATYRGSFFGVKSEFTKMPMARCMGMQLVWMFLNSIK